MFAAAAIAPLGAFGTYMRAIAYSHRATHGGNSVIRSKEIFTAAASPQCKIRAHPSHTAAVLGAITVALCGCTTVAPSHATLSAVAIPADWSGPGATSALGISSLADWWQRFNDPLLTQLVTEALRANTSVQTAQAALRQARAQQDLARATLFPSLGGSISAQRSSGSGGYANDFRAGLDAAWELDIFGANRSALRMSEAEVRASAANLGDVQVSIAAEVALDYIALRGTQARLAIARTNLESQAETLQISEWRRQAGLGTSLEAEQARAAVEQTRAQLPALQTGIDQSSHVLAVLTGQPPAALVTSLAAVRPVPHAPEGLSLSIPAETLRQRADVRAAEHQVRAAVARVAQAQALRAPNFHLGGSLGQTAPTVRALTGGSSFVSALLAGITVPLFEGGALVAQVRVQQAALDQASLQYRAAVLAALTDVEDALAALRGDRERFGRLQQAAEAAGNAFLMARQRYASGLVDFQTVLDTQRTQLSTQESVAIAAADLSADNVRLYKASGGGWNPADEQVPP